MRGFPRRPTVLLFLPLALLACLGPLAPASPTPTPAPVISPLAVVPTQAPPAAPTRTQAEALLPTTTPTVTPSPLATATRPPAATATRTPVPAPVPSPTATPTAAPVNAQRSLQHVRHLSEAIGSRPAGTPQERAAAEYIVGQLQGFGYAVERQDFSFPYFIDRGSRVEVLAPQRRDLHPLTVGLAAAGEVEAPVAVVGMGRAEDLPRDGLKGRIALVQRGGNTFEDKVANAAKAGAAAVIIYNNAQGNFRGQLSDLATVPVVSVSAEEGAFLIQASSQGAAVVRLSVDATSERRQGQNLIATRQGTRPETIIFGAHYDSVEAGPGANDNASGVAALLELARQAQPGPMTLRFIAFSAEEPGLLGSQHYVSTLAEPQRQQIKAMFSLDMVGVGDRLRIGGSSPLVDIGMGAARDMRVDAWPLEGSAAGASDNRSFASAGINAALIEYTVGNELDPHYHSAQDKASFVDPADIDVIVRLGQTLTTRLAGGL